jgi:hypothetical protein
LTNRGSSGLLTYSGAIKPEPIVQPIVKFEALLEEYPKIAAEPERNIKPGGSFNYDQS